MLVLLKEDRNIDIKHGNIQRTFDCIGDQLVANM